MATTRTTALAAVLLAVPLALHSQGPAQQPDYEIPITGEAGPGLEVFDASVRALMRRHGIPGAALAVAKDGRLVYAKAFGYADTTLGREATPDTLFGLASLSKPITALAILKLLEEGKLTLDGKVFDILKHLKPAPGARVDPRLYTITVRQCLNHSGGWDRAKSGDPTSWSAQISRQLRVPLPLTPDQFISFIMGEPLDFAPGAEARYSNVGYIILGQVIEKVSGQPYETYVRKQVLEPAGVRRAGLENPRAYLAGESRRYLAGVGQELPPRQLPMVKAAGGWSASPVDVARLLCALDGSRGRLLLREQTRKLMLARPPAPIRPRDDGGYCGLGWENVVASEDGYGYFQDGNDFGVRAFMRRTPRGLNHVLVFNASFQPDMLDRQIVKAAAQEVHDAVERIRDYPKVDLFRD
jgi:N-acyl-D-amino-acid deacylase